MCEWEFPFCQQISIIIMHCESLFGWLILCLVCWKNVVNNYCELSLEIANIFSLEADFLAAASFSSLREIIQGWDVLLISLLIWIDGRIGTVVELLVGVIGRSGVQFSHDE